MSPQNPQPKLNTKLNIPRLISFLIILILLIAVGAVVGLVAGSIATLPDYDLNNITGALSSTVFDMNGESVASLRTSKDRIALDPEEIPKVMKDAIVAVEDQRFYRHHGIDFIRLGGAVIANITRGYGAEGGSTITQQLVKQAILENPEKTMKRKIQEAIIAIQVEFKYDKEEILALYLNNIYYGHSAWSLQTASQIYFGKDAQDISLAEAALLAGVVNLPGKYSPYLNMDNAKHRQALVLDRMVEMGYITENQAAEAKKEAINLVGLESRSYKYQSFLDYVVDEALAALDLDESEVSQVYTAGYQIYTTMDSKTQEFAEKIYADEKNFPAGKEGKIIQSALVILDPHNGEIRTLIGGRNVQGERLFNRAVNAYRQPGSAFKPIAVFAPALEKGYSPATVLDDYPEEYSTPFGPKTFVNYDGKYRGLVSMRTSLQYSINTTAVKMLQKIGVSEGINFSKNLGITSLVESGSSNDLGLSLALGGLTTGVSPLELTAAYGVFANQGVYVKPHAIKKIEDKDGNILFEHQPEERTVMSAQSAYLMNDML
ncbi:MAG: transglycosylase domain-containing protein, partial [Peptococcia bacterium]